MSDSEKPLMPNETPSRDGRSSLLWSLLCSKKAKIGRVGLLLSLTWPAAMLPVWCLATPCNTASQERLLMVAFSIILVTFPIALVTNIIALCLDDSKVLGAIGLVISTVCAGIWGPGVFCVILLWLNGPLLP